MEANEMKPGTRDEGGHALQEFQWGHHEMRGAIAIGRFQLQDDLTGRGAAQAFVAEGGARDVATQAFEFLPLVGSARGLRMQTKPLGTDTAFLLWCLVIGQAQRGVFPCQHFLSRSGAQRNAVGTGGRMQRGQGRIAIGVSQVGESLFFDERTFAGQALQHPLHDSREDGLELLRRGCLNGLEDWAPVGQAIDAIQHEAMKMNIQIGGGAKPLDERHRAGVGLGAAIRLGGSGKSRGCGG